MKLRFVAADAPVSNELQKQPVSGLCEVPTRVGRGLKYLAIKLLKKKSPFFTDAKRFQV